MNHSFVLSLMICLTAWILPTSAREVRDTLRSDARDKVFVTYDVSYQGNDVTITFISVKKALADNRDGKYELTDIKVLFFERDGEFNDDRFTGDISTNSLREVKADWEYERSGQGYVWVEPYVELRLHLYADESTLSIPIYLANYEKKHTYKIIANCGFLNIHLKKGNTAGSHPGRSTGTRTENTVTTEEIEVEEVDELNNAEIAEAIMERMEDNLRQGRVPSLQNDLKTDYDELRRLEPTITDNGLRNRISSMLQRVRDYEHEIAIDDNRAKIDSILKEGRNDMEYLNDRLDNIDKLSESDLAELKSLSNQLRRRSKDIKEIGTQEAEQLAKKMVKTADRCDEEMKKTEDAKKRRNLLLIIGGILLVVLMFVGNQVFQHMRNTRNQKNIKDMQDKMTKQAKDETRRRIRNTVRSNVNHAESAIKQKSRNTVRNGLNNGINSIIKKKGGNSFTV